MEVTHAPLRLAAFASGRRVQAVLFRATLRAMHDFHQSNCASSLGIIPDSPGAKRLGLGKNPAWLSGAAFMDGALES